MNSITLLILVLAIFLVPIALGNYLAKIFRMPDYGWKLSLILFTIIASAAIIATKWPPKLGIDLSGGQILIYEIDKQQLKEKNKDFKDVNMDQMIASISKRVNPGGVREITVRPYGADQIEIIIPAVEQSEAMRIKEIVSRTGSLEFRILANRRDHFGIIETAEKDMNKMLYLDASGARSAWWVPLVDEREYATLASSSDKLLTRTRQVGEKTIYEVLVVADDLNITGDYLTNATSSVDEKMQPCVHFKFDNTGAQLFAQMTTRNQPRNDDPQFRCHLAIVLDGIIYSAPGIMTAITGGNGQITGNFTQQTVEDLVQVLNAGALPASLKKDPVMEMNSGPTLGADTIQKSSMAMIISAILVPLFMLWYYHFCGLVADFALILKMAILIALMLSVKAAFTLTGLAGLALTVGMAVDNNVLVYERLREELAKGAGLRMAIRSAFHRATATIIDTNMTTFLASLVLFYLGDEQLKGFAIPLILGVMISMYTAVFAAKVIFDILERHQWIKHLSMRHLIGHTNIDFMGLFPTCLTVSIVVTILGVALTFWRGWGLLDIDFTGGVNVQAYFREPIDTATVRSTLTDEKEMPDLCVSDTQVGTEPVGLRFNVVTSNQDQEKVKAFIQKAFGSKLVTNAATIKNIQSISTKAPAKEPEAKPAEKTDENKQSRTNRTGSSWASLAYPGLSLFGQVEATGDKPAVSAETKPTETKPAETAPAKPAEAGLSQPAAIASSESYFEGGTQAELSFQDPVNRTQIETFLQNAFKACGIDPKEVKIELAQKGFVDENDSKTYKDGWTLKMTLAKDKAEPVLQKMDQTLATTPYFPASNSIGGAVAVSTRFNAIYAVILSWILIIIYLWVRFQGVAFGLAAVVALIHDVLVMLAALAGSYWLAQIPGVSQFLLIEQFKINLPIIAAILTIVGYSVNDTIVIFDRIREVRGKDPHLTEKMVNDSTNQTLSRTLLTSVTVILVVVVLYIWGGPALRGFSFALIVGVVTGTYSSIYIAAPILLWLVGGKADREDRQHIQN